jgi:hypothetical protein
MARHLGKDLLHCLLTTPRCIALQDHVAATREGSWQHPLLGSQQSGKPRWRAGLWSRGTRPR